jgi:hypothetical protein
LVPFEGHPGEPFDEEKHKSADEQNPVPDDARIKETLGTGITFQGKLVRPALVVLESPPAPVNASADETGGTPTSPEAGPEPELEKTSADPSPDPGEATLL